MFIFSLRFLNKTVCARRVNLLVCSLPLHRHSYIGFILAFALSIHNKQPTIRINNKLFHFRRAALSSHLKGKVDSTLTKDTVLRINLNIDGVTITSRTHTHPLITLTNISSINLVFIFRCSCSPRNPVYVSRVGSSVLFFSVSSHRHSYICLVFNSHLSNKKQQMFRCVSNTRRTVILRFF